MISLSAHANNCLKRVFFIKTTVEEAVLIIPACYCKLPYVLNKNVNVVWVLYELYRSYICFLLSCNQWY